VSGGGEIALWHGIATKTHLAGACANATVAALLMRRRGWAMAGRRPDTAMVVALAVTALWCLAVAVAGGLSLTSETALALRNLAWLGLLYWLFASDGRHTSVAPVRPVMGVLGMVAALRPLALIIEGRFGGSLSAGILVFHFNTILAMLSVVGALVLVHNLFTSASPAGRAALRWPALALTVEWGFELNLYTVAWLGNAWPVALAAVHGLVDVGFALAIAMGAIEMRQTLRFRPSHVVTFRLASLLLIGAYLLAMMAVAKWLANAGGDFARWLQFGFLIIAVAAALVLLPSRRLRGWLRVMLAKHFFQHRYDYRTEWLRFTRTISAARGEAGQDGDAAPALNTRAIRALADITDSPGGLLLTPEDDALGLAARWQWPIAVPHRAIEGDLLRFLARHDYILAVDGDAAPRIDGKLTPPPLPAWLRTGGAEDAPQPWAVVPLMHFEQLVGAVVLAQPPVARRLDWEDFDLLRVAGQQIASYLAEHVSQNALAEAARFDDFNRRIAFVMHDIKNLASQFSLLARNAERHADNPAFRADMLVTLRASADRLGALVNRLSGVGAAPAGGDQHAPVALVALASEMVGRFAGRHPIELIERGECVVAGERLGIEQALTHLIQNAIEASPADTPVFVEIIQTGAKGQVTIIDSGIGMSAEFIRTRLFRPFDSSKASGLGIGAYQARALIEGMGGTLAVQSQAGVGSRFTIALPLAPTQMRLAASQAAGEAEITGV